MIIDIYTYIHIHTHIYIIKIMNLSIGLTKLPTAQVQCLNRSNTGLEPLYNWTQTGLTILKQV